MLRARMENPTRMQRTEDPAVPDAIKREMGFYISKVTSPPSAQAIVKDGESSLNQSLCEYCRRIFDDRGEVGPVLTTEESGPYYMHWDIPQLERSASDGCALCLLIRRGLSTRDLALVREQALPSRFDYGEFMSDEKIYALRFYYTYIQSNAQGGNAVTLKPVIITLQNEHCRLIVLLMANKRLTFVRAPLFDKLYQDNLKHGFYRELLTGSKMDRRMRSVPCMPQERCGCNYVLSAHSTNRNRHLF